MRKLFWLFCFMLLSSQTLAQDERIYSLRQPTAEEYLAALPGIWYYYRVIPLAFDGYANYGNFEHAVISEIAFRYPDYLPPDAYLTFEAHRIAYQDDFEELFAWYRFWLQPPAYFVSGYFPANHQNYKGWNEGLMLLWLNQNAIDLDALDGQRIEYRLANSREPISDFAEDRYTVTAVNLNNDGQNEWLLRNDVGYYIVVIKQDGIYQKVETPLLWFDYYLALGREEFDYTTLDILDLNADGTNEWILLESTLVRNLGRIREVLILTWRNQSLELIFNSPQIPDPFNDFVGASALSLLNFQNIDEDDAMEILYEGTVLDWNGQSYVDMSLPPTPTVAATPIYTQDMSPSAIFYRGILAFQAQDYQAALAYFDSIPHEDTDTLIQPSDNAQIEALYNDLAFHYWRALSLEALGREQEALAEYVYVLNRSLSRVDFDAEMIGIESILPEYMWYQLTRLHLNIEPPIELPPMSQG